MQRPSSSPVARFWPASGLLIATLCALLCASGCYWIHAREPSLPELSAGIHAETLHVGGLDRSYLLYVPKRLRRPAPLVLLLHGSKQTGDDFRRATGYAFDRLADQHGFVAAYPDAYERRWNDCRARGRFPARKLGVDDVGFLTTLIDQLHERAGIDAGRVFLVGYSNGGQLAFRMATERPERVAALAAFSANLPTPANWSCAPIKRPISALLVNGTGDRINPFEGGRVDIFGFASRGRVRSSLDTAHYFAQLAGLPLSPRHSLGQADGERVDEYRWSDGGPHEVMLLGVHGGGHVVPGPSAAFPSILGDISPLVDGPVVVWNFFARQLARIDCVSDRSCLAARSSARSAQ